MKVICDYQFLDAPNFDILLNSRWEKVQGNLFPINQYYLGFIKKENTKLIMSVCTGSLLLGAAGLAKK